MEIQILEPNAQNQCSVPDSGSEKTSRRVKGRATRKAEIE